MGISHLVVGILAGILAAGSLPLMGISHGKGLRDPEQTDRTHYPSWGLVTVAVSCVEGSSMSSLPLMGISHRLCM